MKEKTGKSASSLTVFVLLGIFALMSVMIVLLFSQQYRKTIDAVRGNGDKRVLESYLSDLARSCDKAGSVSIRELDGVTVICLNQSDGWTRCVYCVDGSLCEQLTDDVQMIDFSFGEIICPLKAFDANLSKRMLQMSAVDKNDQTLVLHASFMCDQEDVVP